MRYLSKLAIAIVICAVAVASPCLSEPAKAQAEPPIVAKCRADLAARLKVSPESIKLIEAQPTVWPDAALGMPEIGKAYAQATTPGHRVTLESGSQQYLYTTSDKAVKYGGLVAMWSYSVLFISPRSNDANLNGDLYQSSLMGTNAKLLLSEVSDFYPQANGIVIAKRRTSRSGHDLLYLKADAPGKVTTLRSALDFGDVAVNASGTEWAGFVRPGLGSGWTVEVAPLGKKDDAKSVALPLPGGIRPDRIAWSEDTLLVLARKGERTVCYQTSPKAETPEWKEVGTHLFPNLPPYMLNKSQTLEIGQAEGSDQPVVEVAKVWFTGDRDVIAKIAGLTLRGFDLIGGGFALVWGDSEGQPAAYTVDISTGEVFPAASGLPRSVKPFAFPPSGSPLEIAK